MKPKKDPYECIRCGYTVSRKDCIFRHLYTLKKPCPCLQNDIELTDDIKQKILANRRYHIPKDPNKTINQTINNYNQLNAFISSMDFMEKITKYTEYKQIEIRDFDDMVDERYEGRVRRLEHDSYKANFQLNLCDLLEIFDNLTGLSHNIEYFNTFFDEKTNKIKFMSFGEWKTMLIESGIMEMIEIVQKCYLNYYECYLIRKLKCPNTGPYNKAVIRERLHDYYKFLACFEVAPYISKKNDNKILYNNGDERYHIDVRESDINSFSIQDEYMPFFSSIKSKLTNADVNKARKDLKEILRKNAKTNVLELNKKMVELFQMDEVFKERVLASISNQTNNCNI